MRWFFWLCAVLLAGGAGYFFTRETAFRSHTLDQLSELELAYRGSRDSAVTLPLIAEERERRHRWMALGGGALACVVLGAAMRKRKPPPPPPPPAPSRNVSRK